MSMKFQISQKTRNFKFIRFGFPLNHQYLIVQAPLNFYILFKHVNYDDLGECSPEKDCLR